MHILCLIVGCSCSLGQGLVWWWWRPSSTVAQSQSNCTLPMQHIDLHKQKWVQLSSNNFFVLVTTSSKSYIIAWYYVLGVGYVYKVRPGWCRGYVCRTRRGPWRIVRTAYLSYIGGNRENHPFLEGRYATATLPKKESNTDI